MDVAKKMAAMARMMVVARTAVFILEAVKKHPLVRLRGERFM